MTGAEVIVRCLEKENTKVIFGYSGVAIDPFWNKILDSKIKRVLVRTEQNAAHLASGYARISGGVGVCAVTSGPGATNLITGIATAYADSIPLVAITGQVNSDMIGSDVFQEADITGAVESFVKYSYLVRDVNDLPKIIKEAFYIASTGRRGPVLIDIPFDIQNAEYKDKFAYPESISMRSYKPTVKGNMAQIKKVIKEVEKAKRPIICVGGGVHLSQATMEIRKFAELNSVPVVSTMMGIGVMPSDHPLFFGMVGNNGQPFANRAMNESDLLLMVGARVADRAVNRPDLITENKVMVHIDVDPAEIGKNVGPTIPLVGDIKNIFQDFLEQDEHADDHSDWLATLNKYKNEMASERVPRDDDYVEPKDFMTKLSAAVNDDAIYVADVGQNQMWSCAYYKVRNGRFLTSGGMGTMGYSIPAAMGAKLAAPDKQVLAVIGDGAFQMSMMELATMRQYGINIKIIVMKNGFLGMVREHQHYAYDDNYSMVELKGDPDLSLIAAAYDMEYMKVTGDDSIENKLKEFFSDDNAAIMEVRVDPMELVKY
ncbi:acetolactate synthase large subunit IlvB1 [Butyrivibrio proteoclasticus B316]|uniref:Acetolactate synthase n=1 Tax=Butyrivibrio proteoclasticus (strain ATCC 51982 / DSM 14932 / B316) TaxID=515622 RepID=E0S282_BUTPB|nr:biosynthetic-type acetolactate synthase large subunit [Butyrivibrio proteoclasticus]ADL33907.1 acetolactate synthase large subunit IlvB1 [Butyrivibrio proteoclasticus B316]